MNAVSRLGVLVPVALATALLPGTLVGEPVTRDQACAVASARLPDFFAGPWRLVSEFVLSDLAGSTAAYTFVFTNRLKTQDEDGGGDSPSAFLMQQRAKLSAPGKVGAADTQGLYGADRYASIVVSADDGEPPVLRCFRGLPDQLVREPEVKGLAAKAGGPRAWRVSRPLLLGLFDIAFCVEDEAGQAEPIVVDLRTQSAMAYDKALEHGRAAKAAVPDPARARLCQEAWRPFRVTGQAKPPSPGPQPVPRGKASTIEPTGQPLLPAPQSSDGAGNLKQAARGAQ